MQLFTLNHRVHLIHMFHDIRDVLRFHHDHAGSGIWHLLDQFHHTTCRTCCLPTGVCLYCRNQKKSGRSDMFHDTCRVVRDIDRCGNTWNVWHVHVKHYISCVHVLISLSSCILFLCFRVIYQRTLPNKSHRSGNGHCLSFWLPCLYFESFPFNPYQRQFYHDDILRICSYRGCSIAKIEGNQGTGYEDRSRVNITTQRKIKIKVNYEWEEQFRQTFIY